MENLVVLFYQDGDDVIVVFKNPEIDIPSYLKNKVFPNENLIVKAIPDVEKTPSSPEDIALPYTHGKSPRTIIEEEKLAGFVRLLCGIQNNAFGEELRKSALSACSTFFIKNKRIKADIIHTLSIQQQKTFLCFTHLLDRDFTDRFHQNDFDTIASFVDSLTEEEINASAKRIANTILSFFE